MGRNFLLTVLGLLSIVNLILSSFEGDFEIIYLTSFVVAIGLVLYSAIKGLLVK